ncbi:MAG TPA: hypothetical protein VJ140_10185 [Actinomycetota bacterium]|nr:hypothetical protein [Actinomycetota bacterium]
MTPRLQSERQLRRFWARARFIARETGLSLRDAARVVRDAQRRDAPRAHRLASGQATLREISREIREDVARAVRP